MRIRPPHAPNSFYHVTLRGNRQQAIFEDVHDRYRWESLLSDAMSRYDSRLHLYCWMTNHIHMVLECGTTPIHKTIHLAAGAYARWFNAKYHHVGHLFQGRYGSWLVDTDAYLLQLIRYIHLNPVVAEIVAAPMAYPWSSYCAYALGNGPPWLTTCFMLRLFCDDVEGARSQMTAFTDCADAISAARVKSADESPDPRLLFGVLVKLACKRFAVDRSALTGPSRSHRLSKARGWVAREAGRLGIANLTDTAKQLNRSPEVISRCIQRYAAEFETSDPR